MRILAALLLLSPALVRGIDLQPTRGGPADLAIRDAAGAVAYARWSDLRRLPTTRIQLQGEFAPGTQTATALFLADLLKAIPHPAGADTVLATCRDGYASVFPPSFIKRYRPFLVLEIDGKGPAAWGTLPHDPGPYAITVSDSVVPGVSSVRDVEHKRPWEVTTVELAPYASAFRAAYTGRWAVLSPKERDGRDIWINSCASCHKGPGGIFSGTKAGRPWQVILAFAAHDRPYFAGYVRSPTSLVPCAKMEPHPGYSDNELSNLIAFIVKGSESP
ncbi:MAG TPA: cytochrome c [Opitutaceae bacterium]|jgi:cytochrome c2